EVVVTHELADGDSHALGNERQRRHRRLGVPELEGADVGSRVSALGQLGVGKAGAQSRLPDPTPDLPGQRPVVDNRHVACLASRSRHRRDYTLRLKPYFTQRPGEPSVCYAAPPGAAPPGQQTGGASYRRTSRVES